MKHTKLILTRYNFDEAAEEMAPALLGAVPAGVPLKLMSEIETINVRELVTQGCPEAIFLKVTGDSMIEDVRDGDWIVVSQMLEPCPGDIVVALVNGEQTLKRFKLNDRRGKNGLWLVPSNQTMPPRELTLTDDVLIVAVVTRIIQDPRARKVA